VLHVVEDDEPPPAAEEGGQRVDQGRGELLCSECPRDGREHLLGVRERSELGDGHPVREVGYELAGHLQRQAGLAHAAGSGEGEQPGSAGTQQVRDLVAVGVPADERNGRSGEPSGRVDAHTGTGRRRQLCAFAVVQTEGVGEGADRVRIRTATLAALQCSDRLAGEPRPGGELLLAERRPLAEGPEAVGEHAGTSARLAHRRECSGHPGPLRIRPPSRPGRRGITHRRTGILDMTVQISRTAQSPSSSERPGMGARVFLVQRIGAVVVGAIILVFGILGFADGLDYFSTDGQSVLGMSSNGLLSTVSVVTAAVLFSAATMGPRPASNVMIIVGTLFLVAGLASMVVLRTEINVLAFEMTNVGFSLVAGLLLLVLGAYGRFGGHLPPDSPYARPAVEIPDEVDESPKTTEEVAAERAMRAAEIAVVNHTATPEQRGRVDAMALVHTRLDRRRVWMEMEAASRR
jgi:hypothetical protein